MNNKRSAKILSLLLALVMMFSLFPVSVFAEGGARSGGSGEGKGNEPIAEEATEVTPYPAATLSKTVDGLTVTAEIPEGALPEGTEMVVTPVSLDAVQTAVDNTDGVSGTVLAAADITFLFDGEEVQPEAEITVTMASAQLADAENTAVVHLDTTAAELEESDVEAEPVEDITVEPAAVTFDVDTFSVYAVIGDVIIDKDEDTLTFEGNGYDVTVTYTKEAQIPAGTRLIVSEIPFGSDEYFKLRADALAKLNENAVFGGSELDPDTRRGIADAIFVDVSLEYNGQPFEPAVPLDVKIVLKQGALFCPAGEEPLVVHFADKGTELIEDVDVTENAVPENSGMPEGVMLNSFDYEQTGFSVVGLVTTDEFIDFETAVPASDFITPEKLLAAVVRAAGDPTINAGKTVTDNNGDGIYELALSVQATSQQSSQTSVTKSNVVMVIDVSGSMDTYVYYDTYTYNADTYDQFRYYTSSTSTSTRLYYGTYYRNAGSSYWPNWVVAGTGWYSGNQYGGTAYSGTVYAYETRLHATQRAACAVVDALLAYNTNDDNITDMFEITVVKFAERTASGSYNGTETVIRDSTSATAIKNAINGLTAGGGTHWRAALEQGLSEANYFKNEGGNENTSVIFLTDGFPTEYGTGNDGGSESDTNVSRSYLDARGPARNIVAGGFTLYNIFAYGNDTTTHGNTSGQYNTGSHTGFQFLRGLANYAYGTGSTNNFNETAITREHCFNAKSTADLVAAFQTIINHITNNVGFAGVNLTDGVSLGATSTSVAVNGTAKPESMRYTVKDDTGRIAYTVSIGTDGKATFTIYNADGTTTTKTDDAPETVTTTINGTTITSQVYSVTVGEGDNAKTYKMSPATIDADTGMVQWDLAGLGILESGYTYTVAFDVWPNQTAYDIAADLNNGIYANIDAALDGYNVTDATERQHIKDAIVRNADGSYSLYTNYEQSVEFYPATSHEDDNGNITWEYGGKQEQPIEQPDPVPLEGSKLPLAKVWESDLALSELNEVLWKNGVVGGTSTEYQITLKVWKADTEAALEAMIQPGSGAEPYITKVLGWDATENKYIFEKDVAVAPGMMLNVTEAAALGYDVSDTSKIRTFTNDQGVEFQYYVIESGHYYYVTEEGSDLHFELETVLYHPMIVDGTLYNVFFGPNGTVVKMDPMYSVVATNTLKGGLNITKVVTDFEETPIEDVEDEFAFIVTIWKENEDGTVSPVYTYDDQFGVKDPDTGVVDPNKAISGSIGYREFGKITNPETGDRETLGRNVIIFENSTNAAAKLEANKRGTHDSVYATLTDDNKTQIILRMPANGEIRLVNLPSGTKYTVTEIQEEVVAPAEPIYSYFKNISYLKYSEEQKNEETGETEIIEVIDPIGEPSTANLGSGTISGNKANLEEFYNKTKAVFYVYHSKDNTVEKISFTDSRVKGTFDAENNKYVYTFDIAAETKTESLYGGYYSNYTLKGANFDAKTMEYVEGWATDAGEGVKPYTGANVVKGVWVLDEALTVNGLEMNPKADTTYFLKEVPAATYLRPYLHYTYKVGEGLGNICTSWLISDTDDLNYTHTGFVIVDTNTDAEKVLESLTVSTSNGTATVKLTPKRVFKANATGNYLTYLTVFNDGRNGQATTNLLSNGNLVKQYWVTPDNLIVTGTNARVYKGLANVNNIGIESETTDNYSVKVFNATPSGDGN